MIRGTSTLPQARAKKSKTLINQCVAELIGTFILLFFGLGAGHSAVLTGSIGGLPTVAAIWGLGAALAIYATSAISGSHINPAITLAFAAYRGFPWRNVVPYMLSQLLGAFLAAAVMYALFHNVIAAFEMTHGLTRGAHGSELSAQIYGEYFPNPGIVLTAPALKAVTIPVAMFAEICGTAMLAFMVFAITDERNAGRPAAYFAPLIIGLVVSILIVIVAPITQACFNPARDLGPRLLSYFAGWGTIAFPGPRGGVFSVYVLSPCLGALTGGALYTYVVRRMLPSEYC